MEIINRGMRYFIPITCPFCFDKFSFRELLFRCINPNCRGREADDIYARAWGFTAATAMGKILHPRYPPSLLSRSHSMRCSQCEEATTKLICPRCHHDLPDAGLINQRSIAIIGGSNTGKSHYIAVLIRRLKREVGPNFQFSVSEYGDETRTRYKREFEMPLFTQKTIIQITPPAQNDPQVRTPLIFRIIFHGKWRNRVLNLYFFDTAGEDMKSHDTLGRFYPYITNAHGIIFLLDPLQIERVREQLPASQYPRMIDPLADPEYIVGRVRELFEQRKSVPFAQKIRVPIAFTLSKIDVIQSLIPEDSMLHSLSEHYGRLNVADVDALSEEIEALLCDWINPSFCLDIKNKFKSYRYFGVSSLGKAPEGGRVPVVRPRRIEEPFLWIMYKLGFIE